MKPLTFFLTTKELQMSYMQSKVVSSFINQNIFQHSNLKCISQISHDFESKHTKVKTFMDAIE
jgi:hypothetical protein